MTSVDLYRLALPRPYVVLVFGVMILMAAVGVAMIVAPLVGYRGGPPFPVAVLWCALLAWNWFVFLKIPYEIRFETGEYISFVSLVRAERVRVTDIDSIKVYRSGGGFYVLRHRAGKILLLAQFTGFYEVVSRIKAANPQFETVGI
jgi:hypothetical protein